MTRSMDASVEAELESASFRWVLLLKLGFDSGDVFISSGAANVIFNGDTYLGIGALGSITGVLESADGGDNRTRATLCPFPKDLLPDLVAEVTTDSPVGRPYTLFMALLDADGAVVDDAITLNAGTMDEVQLADGLESSISIDLVSDAARLKQVVSYRLSDEHQQQLFPGDTGLQYVNDLDTEIRWGSATPKSVGGGGGGGGASGREVPFTERP